MKIFRKLTIFNSFQQQQILTLNYLYQIHSIISSKGGEMGEGGGGSGGGGQVGLVCKIK